MIIAQSIIIVVLCVFLTTCLIIYRKKLSKWSMTSAVLLQMGLMLVTLDKILMNSGNNNFIERIVWVSVWITTVPCFEIIFIEAYIKVIRYNPSLKRLFLIFMSFLMGCIILIIFFGIMEKITG